MRSDAVLEQRQTGGGPRNLGFPRKGSLEVSGLVVEIVSGEGSRCFRFCCLRRVDRGF